MVVEYKRERERKATRESTFKEGVVGVCVSVFEKRERERA